MYSVMSVMLILYAMVFFSGYLIGKTSGLWLCTPTPTGAAPSEVPTLSGVLNEST